MKKAIILLVLIALVIIIGYVSADIIRSSSGNYNVKVYLEKGWNVVYGIPIIQEGYALQEGSTLTKEDIKVIFWYNHFGTKYVQIYPGQFKGFPELRDKAAYVSGSASWVYSEKSGILVYSSIDPVNLQDKKLTQGWNFVGISPEFKMKKLSQIQGTCTFDKLATWDSTNQRYTVISSGETITVEGISLHLGELILADSDSDAGRGFLIKTTGDCQLGSNSIAPPQIPENSNGCIDSDNGENYQIKGYATIKNDIGKQTREDDSCTLSSWDSASKSWMERDVASCSANTNNDASNSKADRCLVSDFICPSDGKGFYKKQKYCPNGCKNGVCDKVEDLK